MYQGCKPKKIWLDNGTEFYNRLMKLWLNDNDIEFYSTHNEGKLVVTIRFNRAPKNKNVLGKTWKKPQINHSLGLKKWHS